MDTPVFSYINKYVGEGTVRLHMPGHKGDTSRCPFADRDITEIDGADSLYEASGIIAESEKNASFLYGCPTFYSTEGSSLAIRAMMYLTHLYASEKGEKAVVLAGRNCHKAFLYAAAAVDFEIKWLCPSTPSYLSCPVTAQEVEAAITSSHVKPTAVYLTSPDYLGNITDIQGVSAVCKRHGVLLLVDNAHGAYLKFLPESLHPIDMGADVCCDSAHKTLPVLTGGAYLHASSGAPDIFKDAARSALALFGSTSPSYLILESLDLVNSYISDGYPQRLNATALAVSKLKSRLVSSGYTLCGDEPLKLTLCPKKRGYTGTELSALLRKKGIVCEFADNDFTVMMFTPEISEAELDILYGVLADIKPKESISALPPEFFMPEGVVGVRQAVMSASELLPTAECVGRVLSLPNCSCPPAVQIVSCGELIDNRAAAALDYYGIKACRVIKQS